MSWSIISTRTLLSNIKQKRKSSRYDEKNLVFVLTILEAIEKRDKLSHDYRGIDPNIVWDVVQNKLDDLKNTMNQMLGKINYDKQVLDEALKTNYYIHLSYLKAQEKGENV